MSDDVTTDDLDWSYWHQTNLPFEWISVTSFQNTILMKQEIMFCWLHSKLLSFILQRIKWLHPTLKMLKGKSTTVHVDVQSVLMVNIFNCSNQFLNLCYTDRESWVIWVFLLTDPFSQCVHVPGSTASHKNCTCRVSKVICRIGTFLSLKIGSFSVTRVFWSAEQQNPLKNMALARPVCEGKGRGQQFEFFPGE